jgi:hypothetical protein
MRSKWKTTLAALVAMLAFAAVTTASASAALPEFETTTWPITYTASSGVVDLQVKGAFKIQCEKSTNTGEIANFKTLVKVHIIYKGCEIVGAETACTSSGAAAGEIRSSYLTTTLVYTNKAAREVGQLVKPEAAGSALAEFKCGLLSTKLTGGVIAKLPNEQVNKSRTSFTWDYKQNAGIQEPTEYEEGSSKVSSFLDCFGTQTGEEATETVTWSASVEIGA